ncbi:hypothetical protein [Chryseobacterium arthrosphaerae]|uniref:hypothetical protein n=1 Tax=Chryseobacterium arthrosphaerae TaxID=651561 RepID=UPI001F4B71AF|nr:hypothetical protein [Chryseobacterium arthrosphaerae]
MSVLEDYKVSFIIKRIHNSDYKLMQSISPALDGIFFEFRRIEECDILLEIINAQLRNSESGEYFFPTQGLGLIIITHFMTSIYIDVEKYDTNPEVNPEVNADYTLPTADLKEIVEAWKNFVVNGE